MPKVTLSSGLSLHYQAVGDGQDVVTMIHGLTGNLAVWHLRIIPLLQDEFRLLTYDLRGHGYSQSPSSGYTLDDMATDLGELLDALDIQRTSIVGHSYGADVALYFAHRHPERVNRVVAIEAALPAMIALRDRADWEGWDFWANHLERSGFHVPAEHRCDPEYLLRVSLQLPKKWGPLNGLPRNPKPFLRLLDSTTIATDTLVVGALNLERIGHIQTPVTLVYTEGSAFMGTCDYLATHLPHATTILMPDSEWGHFGPLEQPDLVAEHIRATLQHTGEKAWTRS
jgi:pimeloyl-ACP methyl ester carboxylesterase